MLHTLLERQLQQAVLNVLPDADVAAVLVRPCPDPKFGDFQSNALMAIAKQRRMNPRQLATDVVARLDVRDWCETVEIAGPGFLNFRLKPEALGNTLQEAAAGHHLFFQKTAAPRTVVVDFSSPNVAKPMHVGHIRSTILGDSLARVLRLLGHRVITDNHIGDWGTQFGKLLVGWKHHLDRAALEADPIAEMERLYKTINSASESDKTILEAARQELVKLQGGDDENLRIWGEMIALSQHQFDEIYGRLGVRFDHTLGESFYNPWLKATVEELKQQGIAQESEGAWVVFFSEPELKDHPAIVQKSDGGFNYATTDLATLRYRLQEWKPDEVVYVTDARQQLHFKQIFATFRKWHPEAKTKLAHVTFGSILGEDGKPFKTRSGDTVKLAELLDELDDTAEMAGELVLLLVVEAQLGEFGDVVDGVAIDAHCVVAGQKSRAARGRPQGHCPHRGVGRGQIRRPPAEPPERLHFLVGQDAFAPGQHRAVFAVRLHSRQKHLSQGQCRRDRRRGAVGRRVAGPRGTGPGPAPP